MLSGQLVTSRQYLFQTHLRRLPYASGMITSLTNSQVRTLATTGLQKLQAGEKEVGDSYLGQVCDAPAATPVERGLAATTRKVGEWARNPEAAAAVHKASLGALAGGAGSSIHAALLTVLDAYQQDRPHTPEGVKTGATLIDQLADKNAGAPAQVQLLAHAVDWATSDDTWHPRKLDDQGIADSEAVQRRALEMLKAGVDDGFKAVGRLGLELPSLCERTDDARAIGSTLMRALSQHQYESGPMEKLAQRMEYAVGTERLSSKQRLSADGGLGGAEEAFKMLASGIEGYTEITGSARLASNIFANASIPAKEANWMAGSLLGGLPTEKGSSEEVAARLAADAQPNWYGGLDSGKGYSASTTSGIQRRVADHLATGDLQGKPLSDAVLQLWKDCQASASDDKDLCRLGSNLLSQFALLNQDAELKPLIDFTLREDLTRAIKEGSYKLSDEHYTYVGDRGRLERTFMLLEAKLHPELPVTDEMKKAAEQVLQDVAAHPRELMQARLNQIDGDQDRRAGELEKPVSDVAKAGWVAGKAATWTGLGLMVGAFALGSAALGGLGVAAVVGGAFAGAGMEVENTRRQWLQTDTRQEGHHRNQVQRMVDAGDRTAELAKKLLT